MDIFSGRVCLSQSRGFPVVYRKFVRSLKSRLDKALYMVFMFLAMLPPELRAQSESTPPPAATESFIQWMIRASGPLGLVMLAMSFYLTALIVWMFLEYRHTRAIPEKLAGDIAELSRMKRFGEIPARVSGDDSFLGIVLRAGLRKLASSGLTGANSAMAAANEAETMRMEHRTTYLATVGTLGPMIGLLGTVYGMILSFRVMATAGANPQASQLASGISTALFATLEGIAVSIPAIFFYAFFRNRISRLSLDVEMASGEIMESIALGLRPAHPIYSGGSSSNLPTINMPEER